MNESFKFINEQSNSALVFVCDHASNALPDQYGLLGLSNDVFNQHVAIDIGAYAVGAQLAQRFDSALIYSCYSRLLVDLNRFPDHASWIPAQSDGINIPGNQHLDENERRFRAEHFFWPYQNAVAGHIAKLEQRGQSPIVVSVHSFTPALSDGAHRPWHYGILSADDRRLADLLIDSLEEIPDICVGDNQPYHANNPMGYTAKTHAEDRGHLNALVEIRQDLIDSDEGVEQRAQEFGDALERALENLNSS
ncbi:MAG: N-formylglutamate amidohydrolase [Pseudomonadota bacterium]